MSKRQLGVFEEGVYAFIIHSPSSDIVNFMLLLYNGCINFFKTLQHFEYFSSLYLQKAFEK